MRLDGDGRGGDRMGVAKRIREDLASEQNRSQIESEQKGAEIKESEKNLH